MKITLPLLFAIYFLFRLLSRKDGFNDGFNDGFKVDAYNKSQYAKHILTNDFDRIINIKDRFKKGLSYERDLGVADKDHKGDTRVSLSFPRIKTHSFTIAS